MIQYCVIEVAEDVGHIYILVPVFLITLEQRRTMHTSALNVDIER